MFTPPGVGWNRQQNCDIATAPLGDVIGFTTAPLEVVDRDPGAGTLLRIHPKGINVSSPSGVVSGAAPKGLESTTANGGAGHEDQWIILESPGTANPLDKTLSGGFDLSTANAVNGGWAGNANFYQTLEILLRSDANGQNCIKIYFPLTGGSANIRLDVFIGGVQSIRQTFNHAMTGAKAAHRWRRGAKVEGTVVTVYMDDLDDDSNSFFDTYNLLPGDPASGAVGFEVNSSKDYNLTLLSVYSKEVLATPIQNQGTIPEANMNYTVAAGASMRVVVPEPTGIQNGPIVTNLWRIPTWDDNETSPGAVKINAVPLVFTSGFCNVDMTGLPAKEYYYFKVVTTYNGGASVVRSTAFGRRTLFMQGGKVGFGGDSLVGGTHGIARANAILAHLNKSANKAGHFTRTTTAFPGGSSSNIWDERANIAAALNADSAVGFFLNNGFNDKNAGVTPADSVAYNVLIETYLRANVPTLQWFVHLPVVSRFAWFPPTAATNGDHAAWAEERYTLLKALNNPTNKTLVGTFESVIALENQIQFYTSDGDHFNDAGGTYLGDVEGAGIAYRLAPLMGGYDNVADGSGSVSGGSTMIKFKTDDGKITPAGAGVITEIPAMQGKKGNITVNEGNVGFFITAASMPTDKLGAWKQINEGIPIECQFASKLFFYLLTPGNVVYTVDGDAA